MLLPYQSSAASAGASERGQFTKEQRAAIRKYTAERKLMQKQQAKTKAKAKVKYVVGETLADDVELYDLPEAVYTAVPAARSYRYIPRQQGGLVLVEPRERRIIDVIE